MPTVHHHPIPPHCFPNFPPISPQFPPNFPPLSPQFSQHGSHLGPPNFSPIFKKPNLQLKNAKIKEKNWRKNWSKYWGNVGGEYWGKIGGAKNRNWGRTPGQKLGKNFGSKIGGDVLLELLHPQNWEGILVAYYGTFCVQELYKNASTDDNWRPQV